MTLKERQDRYVAFRETERKLVKEIHIENLITPKSEGRMWVIRDNGTEIRNSSKQECLNDWATLNGYRIKYATR